MALYTQGFAHAQDRLWQMEKQRKLASGRLAEIFGEKAVNMDKFSLSVGYRKAAQETWDDKN
jgi:penicillin amidase